MKFTYTRMEKLVLRTYGGTTNYGCAMTLTLYKTAQTRLRTAFIIIRVLLSLCFSILFIRICLYFISVSFSLSAVSTPIQLSCFSLSNMTLNAGIFKPCIPTRGTGNCAYQNRRNSQRHAEYSSQDCA